jgi:hypothetical protein
MTMKKLLALPVALLAFALNAQAQDTTPPTVTMTAPVNGVAVFTDRVTVTGTATDDVGVKRVEYRIEGNRRWRRAILTNPDATTTSYVFSYKNKRKGRARRIFVRCRDDAKNESDTLGRKIFRSRSNSAPTTAAAIAANPGGTVGIPTR